MRIKNDLFVFECWEPTRQIEKKSWFDRFAMFMGKRQKLLLKLIRKLHKLQFFSWAGLK